MPRRKARQHARSPASTQPAPRHMVWKRLSPWLRALLILAATPLAYRPALTADFVNWDDDHNVYANRHVRSADGLWTIWFSTDHYQYYPLVFSSFWIEYHLLGGRKTEYREIRDPNSGQLLDVQRRTFTEAAPFHRTNVLLHALNALLVWLILAQLGIPGAFWAALIFALHPVHVESVAWITERKNLLMGLFSLACISAYLRFEDSGSGRSRWLSLFLYVLALLSKAVASMTAPILLVLRWLRCRPLDLKFFIRVSPYFIAGGVMGLVSSWFEHTRQFERLPLQLALHWWERPVLAGQVFWFYVKSLLWPTNLMLVNPRWSIAASSWTAWLWPAGAILAGVVPWACRRWIGRGPAAAVWAFAILLLPASGFFDVYWMVYSWVADHFQYLASVAVIALVCAAGSRGVEAALRRWEGKPARVLRCAAFVLAAATACALGRLTYHGSERFANSRTLWERAIEANPDAWIAYNFLGVLLAGENQYAEAIPYYTRTLALFPQHAYAHYNLGVALLNLGRVDEALDHYRQAVELSPAHDPHMSRFHDSYGRLLAQLGRHGEAIEQFRAALDLEPVHTEMAQSLAGSLAALGRNAEAAEVLEQAAERIQSADPARAADLRRQAAQRRAAGE